MQNSLDSLPNIVIFDFLYGVAAYNCWKSASILGTMEEYYVDHYEFIPVPVANERCWDLSKRAAGQCLADTK